MSDDDFGAFALPPFVAADGLARLRRELRALGLEERGGVFERRGLAIARAAVEDGLLRVAVVARPARASPQWADRVLASSAQVRDFVADLKKKLDRWTDRDD
jgi:hypothetical protein